MTDDTTRPAPPALDPAMLPMQGALLVRGFAGIVHENIAVWETLGFPAGAIDGQVLAIATHVAAHLVALVALRSDPAICQAELIASQIKEVSAAIVEADRARAQGSLTQ